MGLGFRGYLGSRDLVSHKGLSVHGGFGATSRFMGPRNYSYTSMLLRGSRDLVS